MVDTKLESRLPVNPQVGTAIMRYNSYWSTPNVTRPLSEKSKPISLNSHPRDYTTTFGLRQAIYLANK